MTISTLKEHLYRISSNNRELVELSCRLIQINEELIGNQLRECFEEPSEFSNVNSENKKYGILNQLDAELEIQSNTLRQCFLSIDTLLNCISKGTNDE